MFSDVKISHRTILELQNYGMCTYLITKAQAKATRTTNSFI